ncbi:MAG: RNA methyltransferase [Bacteroidota bacterium]|nr:RNA methyltransferase [Bacteroidota bacterium]
MLSKKIVKYIQSLTHKKERREEPCFIAEGPRIIEEFLEAGIFPCEILCAEADWIAGKANLLKEVPSVDIHEIDDTDLKRISLLKTPNKVVGVFRKRRAPIPDTLNGRLTLALDGIQDPGNMGTLIRIADWFGIENLICSENAVDCYNPKVVQSAMGSLGRVNVVYTALVPFLEIHARIPVCVATMNGTPLQDVPRFTEGILVIGNESRGISTEVAQRSTHQITIPRIGMAESLNAAVAAGIILAHMKIG